MVYLVTITSSTKKLKRIDERVRMKG